VLGAIDKETGVLDLPFEGIKTTQSGTLVLTCPNCKKPRVYDPEKVNARV
jgi:hypothetical protein